MEKLIPEPHGNKVLYITIPNLGPKLLATHAATDGTSIIHHHVYHHPDHLSSSAIINALGHQHGISTTAAKAIQAISYKDKIFWYDYFDYNETSIRISGSLNLSLPTHSTKSLFV